MYSPSAYTVYASIRPCSYSIPKRILYVRRDPPSLLFPSCCFYVLLATLSPSSILVIPACGSHVSCAGHTAFRLQRDGRQGYARRRTTKPARARVRCDGSVNNIYVYTHIHIHVTNIRVYLCVNACIRYGYQTGSIAHMHACIRGGVK